MTFNQYIPISSFMHKLNSTLKYISFIILVFISPFLEMRTQVILFIFINILVILSKIPLLYFYKRMIICLIVYFVALIFAYIFSYDLIYFPLSIAIRVFVFWGYINLILFTTPINDLIQLVYRASNVVMKKNKAREFTMITFLVLNFIPLFLDEIEKIKQSFKSRGIKLKGQKLNMRIKYLGLVARILFIRIDNLVDEYDLLLYGRNINLDNVDNLKGNFNFGFRDITFIVLFVVAILI